MTILELLKKGCEIKFPSGYILTGDPETKYIDCAIELAGERHPDGVWELTPDGLKKALKDAKYHEEQNK